MITNYSSLAAFIISFICLAIYAAFLAPRQWQEVFRPKDWLSGLRWIILGILILTIITSIPGTFYQYYRTVGDESEVLRSVSTVSTNISKLGTTILLVLVYTYKRRD